MLFSLKCLTPGRLVFSLVEGQGVDIFNGLQLGAEDQLVSWLLNYSSLRSMAFSILLLDIYGQPSPVLCLAVDIAVALKSHFSP